MGSALLGAGLGLIVTGSRSAAWWLPTVATGVGLLLGFAWWERRAADPVVNLALFKRRAFAAGSLIIGLQNFAMYALLFELPVVFSTVFGASSAQSGRALISLTMAMVIGSVVGGSAAGIFGTRRAALVGTTVAFSGGVLMALGTLTSVNGAVPALMALGLGLGLTTPAANAALMAVAKPSESGMASGASSTVRYLGGIAGVATVSAMVANESLLAAHQHSALLFAMALAMALALAWLIPGHKPGAAAGARPDPASDQSGSKSETTRV
jgi:MFS family permease